MGKSSGGTRKAAGGGLKNDGSGSYTGKIGKAEGLATIKNTQLRREIQQGISKYESRLGVRQTNVKIADLSGAYGVHVTQNGKSSGVFLDKKTFQAGTTASVSKSKTAAYNSGFLTKTNKAVQHTVVHELGHATWNSHLTGRNQVAASRDIREMYKKFQKDVRNGKAKGYGSYARSNVNEFWAEASTKAVLGKPDKYTRFVKATIKKYKL